MLSNYFTNSAQGKNDALASVLSAHLDNEQPSYIDDNHKELMREAKAEEAAHNKSKKYKLAFHGLQLLGGGGLAASGAIEICTSQSENAIRDVAGRLGTGLFNITRNAWQITSLSGASRDNVSQKEILNNAVSAGGNSMQPVSGLMAQKGDINWMDKDVLPGMIALGVYAVRSGNYFLDHKLNKQKLEQQDNQYTRAVKSAFGKPQAEEKEASWLQKSWQKAGEITMKALFMAPSVALVGRGIAQTIAGAQAMDTALMLGGAAQTLGPIALTVGDYLHQKSTSTSRLAEENKPAEPVEAPLSISKKETLNMTLTKCGQGISEMLRPVPDMIMQKGRPHQYQFA